MTKQSVRLNELMDNLNKLYPSELAEEWDQVGLHFGYKDANVSKVMTTLDVRPEVVEEALKLGVDTIIVHHPILFSPVKRFDNSTADLRMYTDLIKNDINVFVLHTNLDKALNGMNDWLANALKLNDIKELEPSEDGLSGLGRVGNLPETFERRDLISYIKDKLNANNLTLIERTPKEAYNRVAIVGGSSFDSLSAAIDEEADVFITGDITFHKGQDAYEFDILTIDSGHYIEHIFKEKMATVIKNLSQENQWDIEVIESTTNTNPFMYE